MLAGGTDLAGESVRLPDPREGERPRRGADPVVIRPDVPQIQLPMWNHARAVHSPKRLTRAHRAQHSRARLGFARPRWTAATVSRNT